MNGVFQSPHANSNEPPKALDNAALKEMNANDSICIQVPFTDRDTSDVLAMS